MGRAVLILSAVGILLAVVLYLLCKKLKAEAARAEELERQLRRKEESLRLAQQWIKEAKEISKDAEKKNEEIESAKTDEDVYSAVAGIIDANNSRVQDHKGNT